MASIYAPIYNAYIFELKTEQNTSGLCNLREMLHVFANLLINAVDIEVERKLDERLGATPDSSESDGME